MTTIAHTSANQPIFAITLASYKLLEDDSDSENLLEDQEEKSVPNTIDNAPNNYKDDLSAFRDESQSPAPIVAPRTLNQQNDISENISIQIPSSLDGIILLSVTPQHSRIALSMQSIVVYI